MSGHRGSQSVLIVSFSERPVEAISSILPHSDFHPVYTALSAAEARRKLLDGGIDIVIINAPLTDEFGTQLAVDTVTTSHAGVLLLVKADVYEEVSYKMEQYGVLTLTKSLDRQTLFQTIKLLTATAYKMKRLEESTVTLEQKLRDMKLINKAKVLLIECLKMGEEEAHKYIEREAMDNCVKKSEIARQIIEKYEA
ncbi:MAG: ANTAR domain-containing protein [Lachnospiraceae bacterium]|nr:ANTAR domain-containing protein [Lachnospiraceae bacterium]